MSLVVIFLSLAPLVLAALLVRQVGLTRKANEGLAEWRRRYERAHRDHTALRRRYLELEGRNESKPSRSGGEAGRTSAALPGRQAQRTNRPTATLAEPEAHADPVPEPLTLVLPIQLLSKNARDKLHYRARHRLRKDYQNIIRLKYPRRGEPPRVKQRVTVTRVLGSRERPFDEQNVGAGSAVELIDALTAAGYWIDDAPRWLETAFGQGKHPAVAGPAVVVEIVALA